METENLSECVHKIRDYPENRENLPAQSGTEHEPQQPQPGGSRFPQVSYCGRHICYPCLPITFIGLLIPNQTCNKMGIALSQYLITLK